jgi:hypothetical protein
MYFIYKKQINVASEYSYNVDSIVEWFKDYIDQDDIIEAYGGVEEVTAKDIVDDIFCESDSWYDDFIKNFDIESDVVENMYSEDIAEQIKEVAGDKLVDYYTKYLKELQKMIDLTWREIRQVFVEEDTLYSALLYVYRTYIGDENDSIDEIIEGIQDYIEDYIEELIKKASPYDYSNGDIDAEDITELVTKDEFLEKFKEWYENE